MTHVRIISEPLGGSALSKLIQAGEAPASWIPTAPTTPGQWRERIGRRQSVGGWPERIESLLPAFNATGAAAQRLERVRSAGGIVVTTGQQPGLFGGPVYTFSKAMGALALADALERETGIPAAAVFWAATDDADFAEASYTIVARRGGADELRSRNAPAPGTPMALARLGDVSGAIASLKAVAGSSADPRFLEAVERSYKSPDTTVGESYVALLREMLAPLGMPVLDASHDAVRAASDEILRAALRRSAEIERRLVSRRAEIVKAGYEPQVDDVSGLSPVFVRDGTIKRRVTTAEAESIAGDERALLTPNVLLRAIVEQTILPTVAYLGGPGELAYFAQVSAVASALQIETPLALPRWSCTLVEPHIDQLLTQFGVKPDDLARPDALESNVARSAIGHDAATALGELRIAISALPGRVESESASMALGAAVEGATQSLLHRIDRLERRLAAGIKRREDAVFTDLATLRAALYPRNTRQERALNLIPLLSRHGGRLLLEMRDAAGAHATTLLYGGSGSAA